MEDSEGQNDKRDDDDEKNQQNGSSIAPVGVVADYASSTSLTSQEEPDNQPTSSMEDLMTPMDQDTVSAPAVDFPSLSASFSPSNHGDGDSVPSGGEDDDALTTTAPHLLEATEL